MLDNTRHLRRAIPLAGQIAGVYGRGVDVYWGSDIGKLVAEVLERCFVPAGIFEIVVPVFEAEIVRRGSFPEVPGARVGYGD